MRSISAKGTHPPSCLFVQSLRTIKNPNTIGNPQRSDTNEPNVIFPLTGEHERYIWAITKKPIKYLSRAAWQTRKIRDKSPSQSKHLASERPPSVIHVLKAFWCLTIVCESM